MVESPPTVPTPKAKARSSPWTRYLRAAVLSLGAIFAMVSLTAAGLDTGAGRTLIVAALNRLPLGGGLRLHLGRLEGSIYGRMILRQVTLSDPRGVFLAAPEITLDWRPRALLDRELRIESLTAPLVDLIRAPSPKPEPPKVPPTHLPDFHVRVARLAVQRLVLEPALTGERRTLRVDAAFERHKGRIRLQARAQTLATARSAGGDQLAFNLDAEPKRDHLTLKGTLRGPDGGVIDHLLGLKGSVVLDLGGVGGWRSWSGALSASLAGQPLFNANLTARNGDFSAVGRALPGPLLPAGPVRALVAPGVVFSLGARLTGGQAAVDAHATSARLEASLHGGVDLDHNRLDALKVQAALSGTHDLLQGMTGRDLRLNAVLSGSWDHPDIDYGLGAAELSQGDLRAQGLTATGEVRQGRSEDQSLAFKAAAAAVVGLPAPFERLGDHVTLQGDLALRDGRVSRGDFKERSDGLSAELILDKGSKDLAGTLKAEAPGFHWRGLGVADLALDARLRVDGGQKVSLDGAVHAHATSIEDPTVKQILGGPATLDAHLAYGVDGDLGLQSLTLLAPDLKIASGQGRLAANGQIQVDLHGVIKDHGPVRVSAAGTLAAPRLRLEAPAPGLATLSDLTVEAEGQGGSLWRIGAHAKSPQGPFILQAKLDAAASGLDLDIDAAKLGDMTLSGRAKETPAGPFAGTLTLAGSGLSGSARLVAAGADQAVTLTLNARKARLPTIPAVTIARGSANLDLILGPGSPTLSGVVNLAGVKRQGVSVAQAKVRLALKKGLGDIHVSASGSRTSPFTLNAAATLAPDLIQISGTGSFDKTPVRLEAPASLHLTGGGYHLDPVALVLPHGRLVIAATQSLQGLKARVGLQSVDLALSRVLDPDLDLGGVASGVAQIDLPASGAMPTAHVQVQVSQFTRTAAALVSPPVDISLLADLSPAQAQAHLLARKDGAVIGRVQLALHPATGEAGRSWFDRLAAAPVTGGLRYDGPSEILWGLGGVGGQTLSGPVAIGVDVSGRLEDPQLTGVLHGRTLRFSDPALGAVIDQIAVDGHFAGSRLELASLTARAGEGTLTASGFADLAQAAGFPLDLKIKLSRARLASTANAGATVSGDLDIAHDKDHGARITGSLTLDQAKYDIGQSTSEDVATLSGVRWVGAVVEPAATTADDPFAAVSKPSAWKLDVKVSGGSHIFVTGLGLEAEWRTALHIGGDVKDPTVVGDVDLVRGSFEFAGRKLSLTRGVIHLAGANPPDPILDIEATTTVSGVTAAVDIAGTANHPQISFTSTPALPQDQVLARLLFGGSATSISPLQAVQLAASLNALRGGGADPLGRLQKAVKLDRLSVYAADPSLGRGASVGAGKYINSRVYVEVTTDARGYAATQVEIALTKAFRLLSQIGTMVGGTSLNLQYTKQY